MKNYEKIINPERCSLKKALNYLYNKNIKEQKKNEIKIPTSIKPSYCAIPRDLNLKEIFIQLFNSSFLLYNDNKIFTKLSEEENAKRKYIIESIKKFIIHHRIKYKILYNIVYMFDILICYNNKNKLISSLEQLGLGSSILMTKFIYDEFLMIPFENFQSLYEKNNFTLNQLQEIEVSCLKLINYYMNFPTPLSFMELLLLNGVVFNTDNIKNEISHKIYNMILIILEKIMFMSNEYTKYNPLYLCCCIVAYCREYYEIERWPKILAKVFNVNQKHFENIYNEFFLSYNHHYVKSVTINDKFLNKKSEKNISYKNNQEKNTNDININNINKNNNNKEKDGGKEYNNICKYTNSNFNILRVNYNSFNIKDIKVSYKTSQEIKNSSFFRKMDERYSKTNYKNMNKSDNINIKNNIETSINNQIKEECNNANLNYDVIPQQNIYKTINPIKKTFINIYKTPLKFINDSCFYNPNKNAIEFNKVHQRFSSNNLAQINNNNFENIQKQPIFFIKDSFSNNYDENDMNTNNIIEESNQSSNQSKIMNKRVINKNKHINNSIKNTIDIIRPKTKLTNNEKIKVRIKEINFISNNKNNDCYEKKVISTETDCNKKYNKNNIYKNKDIHFDDNRNGLNESNENNKLKKKINSSIRSINNNINNINDKENIQLNQENNINNGVRKYDKNKNSRNSSFNDKLVLNANYNKEEDYSNDTTSENSHNFSIRRSYFRLKRMRDQSAAVCHCNEIKSKNNIANEKNPQSIFVIKCNLKDDNIDKKNNGSETTKFKDCLKIAYDSISIDKKIKMKNDKNEKEKENLKENRKMINGIRRFSDIRNFYKSKNIYRNRKELNDNNKENKSRNYILE